MPPASRDLKKLPYAFQSKHMAAPKVRMPRAHERDLIFSHYLLFDRLEREQNAYRTQRTRVIMRRNGTDQNGYRCFCVVGRRNPKKSKGLDRFEQWKSKCMLVSHILFLDRFEVRLAVLAGVVLRSF